MKPVETKGYPSLIAYVEAKVAHGWSNAQMAVDLDRKKSDIARVRQNLQYRSQRGGVR